MRTNKGISLIVLVITIIVIIILAGAVILSLSNNNPIEQAKEATFKTSMESYNSELTLYISNQYVMSPNNFNPSNLNASTVAEIKSILTDVTDEFASKLRIVKGSLSYIGTDSNEIKWAKENNISLDVPYVKSGLILWYDGVYNGGIGIHNDNTNANKGIWKDLSGTGNDGTLQSFDFNTTNGWITNGLQFNGRPNLVNFNMSLPNKHTIEFIVMPRRSGYNGVFSAASNITKNYSASANGTDQFLFYNTAVSPGSNYIVSGLNRPKQSLFTMLFDGTTVTRTMYHNNISQSVTYCGGGVSGDFSDYTSFLLGNGGWGALSGEIYAVRVYNRLLTPSEITQNYEIDKVRYGI